MENLEHYRNAVRSYPGLQGLRIIPLGLLFLIFPLQLLNLPVLGRQGNCTITLPLLVAAIVSWFWIGKYYQKTFGKVEPLVDHKRLYVQGAITVILVIAVIVLENVLFRNRREPPFNMIEFIVALAALYAGIKTQRWYYSLGGLLMGAASFLPLILGVGAGDFIFGEFGACFDILYGLLIILIGILDHLRLVKYFQPEGAGAHAGNP